MCDVRIVALHQTTLYTGNISDADETGVAILSVSVRVMPQVEGYYDTRQQATVGINRTSFRLRNVRGRYA